MRMITVFETASELFDCLPVKTGKDHLSPESYICFEDDMEFVSIQPSNRNFVLGSEVTAFEIIKEMGKRLGIRIDIT